VITVLQDLGNKLVQLIREYPAATAGVVASVVVALASVFGVVVDKQDALQVALLVIPVLVGAGYTHSKVSPVSKKRSRKRK
jgi:hypothetical protein